MSATSAMPAVGDALEVTDSEVDELRAADVMQLQPGDVVVISVPRLLSPAAATRLRDRAGVLFPDHQVLILDGGGWIAAIRPAA